MTISKYNGQYVNIESIHNYEEIHNYIKGKEKIYSNLNNYVSLISKLVAYEKTRNYVSNKNRKKVYAKQLLIMLPKELTKSQKHEVIKEFMLNISRKYKEILYIYRFEIIGKGLYCRIIVFERQVYKKKHKILDCYTRDMYINKQTGRTSNASDPNAILRCKKGDIKKDQDGKPLVKDIEVSPKKYEYLKYRDNNIVEKKINNFTNFKDRLTKMIVISLSKVLKREMNILKLRFIPYGKENKITNKILHYNTMISKINIEFIHLQKLFQYEHAFDDYEKALNDFNSMFYTVLNQISKKSIKINNGLVLNIDPQSKDNNLYFYVNIQTFEKIVKNRIINFYYKYFYDPMFDNYYTLIDHPFMTLKMNKTHKYKNV